MIIEWTLNGQYHDRHDVILTSRMAVSNIFLMVTVIQNEENLLLLFDVNFSLTISSQNWNKWHW